ncbi:MAG: CDP-diacylglycerol--glycerol-3-phosphate 3-phosphatidyltransferase [bacterium]
MNLPNKLTISRIVLIPVFVILVMGGRPVLALLAFALACLTDALDGIIARVRGQKSKLGAYLDPIADKLLINTSFITLAVMKRIPSWIAIIIISRDVLIVLGVSLMTIMEEQVVIAPTLISKSTTTAQMTTLLVALVDLWRGGLATVLVILIWISALLTVLSGLDYLLIAARTVHERA